MFEKENHFEPNLHEIEFHVNFSKVHHELSSFAFCFRSHVCMWQCFPTQDASHHRESSIFITDLGSQPKTFICCATRIPMCSMGLEYLYTYTFIIYLSQMHVNIPYMEHLEYNTKTLKDMFLGVKFPKPHHKQHMFFFSDPHVRCASGTRGAMKGKRLQTWGHCFMQIIFIHNMIYTYYTAEKNLENILQSFFP